MTETDEDCQVTQRRHMEAWQLCANTSKQMSSYSGTAAWLLELQDSTGPCHSAGQCFRPIRTGDPQQEKRGCFSSCLGAKLSPKQHRLLGLCWHRGQVVFPTGHVKCLQQKPSLLIPTRLRCHASGIRNRGCRAKGMHVVLRTWCVLKFQE